MNVTEIVLARLNLQESTPSINIAIAEVEQAIKTYCSISDIPSELNFIWADMAINLVVLRGSNGPVAGNVLESIDMGDVSYSFDNEASGLTYLQEIVGNYKAHLNRYRKGLFGNVVQSV